MVALIPPVFLSNHQNGIHSFSFTSTSNYVELGLLGIKNIDLPQKLHRRTKAKRIRERKRVLGRSIEERPESVDSREEFGHWEIDEVIGRKSDKDKVLLTMVERKTRKLCVLRLADKSSRSLMEAFQRIQKRYRL